MTCGSVTVSALGRSWPVQVLVSKSTYRHLDWYVVDVWEEVWIGSDCRQN